MKKKIIAFLFISVVITGCVDVLDRLSLESSLKRTILSIKSEYKGIVIEKYSTRELIMPPTHLKVLTLKKDTIDISPNEEIVDNIKIGDTIQKIKNENMVFVKNSDGISKKYFYIKISQEERSHKKFPKEWKYKWKEATVE